MGKNKKKENRKQKQEYCPFCHLVVAPGNKEVIWVKLNGNWEKAHLSHAVAYYVETIGGPPATGVTESWQFRNYLIDQAECLIQKRYTKKEEKKLQAIFQIHEELFGQPLKISTLLASA